MIETYVCACVSSTERVQVANSVIDVLNWPRFTSMLYVFYYSFDKSLAVNFSFHRFIIGLLLSRSRVTHPKLGRAYGGGTYSARPMEKRRKSASGPSCPVAALKWAVKQTSDPELSTSRVANKLERSTRFRPTMNRADPS